MPFGYTRETVRRLSLVLVLVAIVLAPSASAGRNLFVGVDEDGFKTEPAAAARDAGRLGLSAFRITLAWAPGEQHVSGSDVAVLRRAIRTARGLRPVLAVYAHRATDAPTSDVRREEYCSYLRSVLASVPRINDFVVWNEPNKSFFWRPQFHEDGTSAAPGAYEALLARCWDALHSVRSTVNLIGPATSPRGNDEPNAITNISHSPGTFIRKIGAAYRASGRRQPILDTIGHHVHGLTAAEPPSQSHVAKTIAEGDLGKLLAALRDAFHGTPQPYPGRCVSGRCIVIWYLEAGYQTEPDPAKRRLYTDAENDPRPVAAAAPGAVPDQARQILAGIRLAYCQPFVEAYFNFLLWDERSLAGWQSAPYWVDRKPKGSFPAFKEAIREVNERRVDCGTVAREAPAAVSTEPPHVPAHTRPSTGPTRSAPSPPGTATTGVTSLPGSGPGSTSTVAATATREPDHGDSTWQIVAVTAALGVAALLVLMWWMRRHGRGEQ